MKQIKEAALEVGTDIIHLLEIRVYVYDLLRRTFLSEPSMDFLKAVGNPEVIDSFPFVEESSVMREGVEQVSDFFKAHDVSDEKVFDSLNWDYTRMFIGPYNLPAPPWESAYVSKERLLFQEETLRVRRRYLKYGFLPSNHGHEADDHLSLELDFMYRLSELTLQRVKGLDQEDKGFKEVLYDQKKFLEEHLLKWVPDLTRDIVKSAKTDFYVGMAKVLKGFLEIDLKALNELLDTKIE